LTPITEEIVFYSKTTCRESGHLFRDPTSDVGSQKSCLWHSRQINDLDIFSEMTRCCSPQKRCPWVREFSEKSSLETSPAWSRHPAVDDCQGNPKTTSGRQPDSSAARFHATEFGQGTDSRSVDEDRLLIFTEPCPTVCVDINMVRTSSGPSRSEERPKCLAKARTCWRLARCVWAARLSIDHTR